MNGRVVHFEIPFDDPARAKTFYASAFDWSIADVPGMEYAMVSTTPAGADGTPKEPGAINGGMLRRTQPFTTPMITVEVEDIERALAEVQRFGGSVVQTRQAVGDMGFSGYFTDTEGNMVGLWQSA